MDGADWADPNARAIAVYLDGADDPDRAEDGTRLGGAGLDGDEVSRREELVTRGRHPTRAGRRRHRR
jgi:hypothetical protein